MRPTPIPANEVWDGGQRLVIGPPAFDPDGDEVAAVEVIVDASSIGPRLSARCGREPGDLDALAAGGTVWVSFYGQHLHPFAVDVQPPAGPPRPYVRMEVDFDADDAPGFRAYWGGVPDGMAAADFAEGCAQALTEMAAEWRAAAETGETDG